MCASCLSVKGLGQGYRDGVVGDHGPARGMVERAGRISLHSYIDPGGGPIRMRKLIILGLAVLLVGCGPKEPLHKGKPASYWTQALQDPDAQTRREAAGALAALKAKAAVPELITALKDKDDEIRAKAAEALWSIGSNSKDAIPALTAALKDKSAAVRLSAAGALGEMAPEAQTAIPALRDILKDKDAYVRAQS